MINSFLAVIENDYLMEALRNHPIFAWFLKCNPLQKFDFTVSNTEVTHNVLALVSRAAYVEVEWGRIHL